MFPLSAVLSNLITAGQLITALVCRHFDKEKSGRLNHQEFKSCLRSLGYDLPMVEEGEPDPEFQAILDTVDPNRWVACGGHQVGRLCCCRGVTTCTRVLAGTGTCPCRSTWPS